MGEHKHNPTAIAAKNGELPPKQRPMSKRQMDAIMRRRIQDATGLPQIVRALDGDYYYI